ncbi:MAG: radical SAM protein [Candidatus Aenigmatarchaeota archaeon]
MAKKSGGKGKLKYKIPFKQIWKIQLLIRSVYLFPSYVQIEPTTKCNLKCKTCIRSRIESGVSEDMQFDLFKSIIDQLRRPIYATQAINITGLGEPFMNPNIILMVRYAKKKGLNVMMDTNLTKVDDEILKDIIDSRLDTLVVSFDGASKETFENIRVGAVFEKVVENIKLLLDLKKKMKADKPTIILNSTICEENVHEIPEMIKAAEELGVNAIVFMKQVVPGENYWKSKLFDAMSDEIFSGTKVKVVGCLDHLKCRCVAPRSCYITFDGKVLPCYPIYEIIPREEYAHYQMGDLTKQAFHEIWFSERYKRLRTQIIDGSSTPFCESCFASKFQ